MAHQPLGIGVIGAGNILKRHVLAYQAAPDLARLVAVVDTAPKRAEVARAKYGFADALTDHRELLARDDVHVVDICTPANLHAAMMVDALTAGKHVLCEKPMATTLHEADEISAAAEAHRDRTVSVVFQLRAEAAHRRMRLMIEKGRVGRPLAAAVTLRVRKTPAYYRAAPGRGSWAIDGGGVLVNQAIHQLDALISFLGEPAEVSAVMDTFVQPTEGEDTIAGWIRFQSGAFASINCSVCAQNKNFQIEVLCENAALSIGGNPDANTFGWTVRASSKNARKSVEAMGKKLSPDAPDPGGAAMAVQKLSAKLKRRPWVPPAHWGHAPFVRQFLIAARDGAPGPLPPAEARKSLELAAALYASAIEQRVVSLPLGADCRVYRGAGVEPEAAVV